MQTQFTTCYGGPESRHVKVVGVTGTQIERINKDTVLDQERMTPSNTWKLKTVSELKCVYRVHRLNQRSSLLSQNAKLKKMHLAVDSGWIA